MAGNIKRVGDMRNMYTIKIGRRERKRQCCNHKIKWDDNIKVNLKEISCEDMDWIDLAQEIVQWQILMNTTIKLLSSKKG